MVHYDHGNGVAVADVDGDGRLDLYFTSQIGPNGLWRNLGHGKFEDITAKAGVAVADRISVAASFADLDNDGDPDLYVTTVRMGNLLFENLGEGKFRDVTEASGLGHVGHSSGATFFDYDRDGYLDLFLANVGVYTFQIKGTDGAYIGFDFAFDGHLYPERFEKSLLFRNQGGIVFRNVTETVGLDDTSFAGDAAAADFDGDGWPDLYVLNMEGDDHFYRNEQGKKFVEDPDRFPGSPWGAMGIAVFDYDRDGRFDLYLTDMHSDMSRLQEYEEEGKKSQVTWDEKFLQGGANNIFGNALFHDLGEGKIAEVSDELGVENYWPWGVSSGDLDADGFEDLFVTASMNYPFRFHPNSVFMNLEGHKFIDMAFPLGVEPRLGNRLRKDWFSVDCSGDQKEKNYCASRSGPHVVTSALGSRSSALLDLEGDGDLDVITNEFNSAPQVLVSDLAAKREVRFVQIRLVGTESNRDGIGATVRVEAGDAVQYQYHDGKSGYLSQSSMPLYFGLGTSKQIDEIRVVWPSGFEQTVPGPIMLNRTMEIVEQRPK